MPLEPLLPDQARHTWETLVGNGLVRDAIQRALAEGRLPHGLLLHGPEHVGKMGFAVAIAKHLMAGQWPPESEEAHRTVAKIGRSSHPDILCLRPDMRAGKALQIKIDDVREVERLAPLSPIESPWKVVIIDGAERMNPQTANSLLKVLEEPPGHCKFLLVSHRRSSLLPTVISRCTSVRFGPVPSEELVPWLVESQGLERSQAELAARWSEGRPGAALALPLAEWESHLGEVSEAMERFIVGDFGGVFDTASRLLGVGKRSKTVEETPLSAALRWARLWLRDRLVATAAPGEPDLLTRGIAGATDDGWSISLLCTLGDEIERLWPLADRTIDAQLALESALTTVGAVRGKQAARP
jgi:DNA polymerase III subunit delta'